MAGLWRPFETDQEPSLLPSPSSSSKGAKGMKIRVCEIETEVIMDAYMHSMEQGWTAVLSRVKARIQTSAVNPSLANYYMKEQDKKVVRRMKRIVTEELKKQAVLYQKTASQKRCPEKEFQHRVEETSNADFNATSVTVNEESVDAQTTSSLLIDKQMRYATKSTPEQRKKDKFSAFVDSDDDKRDDDDDDDVCPPKKKKTLREVSYEAQSAHSKMCAEATSSLNLMSKVLNKLEKKLDDGFI